MRGEPTRALSERQSPASRGEDAAAPSQLRQSPAPFAVPPRDETTPTSAESRWKELANSTAAPPSRRNGAARPARAPRLARVCGRAGEFDLGRMRPRSVQRRAQQDFARRFAPPSCRQDSRQSLNRAREERHRYGCAGRAGKCRDMEFRLEGAIDLAVGCRRAWCVCLQPSRSIRAATRRPSRERRRCSQQRSLSGGWR